MKKRKTDDRPTGEAAARRPRKTRNPWEGDPDLVSYPAKPNPRHTHLRLPSPSEFQRRRDEASGKPQRPR